MKVGLDPMRALASLTPSGSEFVDDPQRCVDFVKASRQSQHDMIVKLTVRKNDLEAQLSRLRERLSDREGLADLISAEWFKPVPPDGPFQDRVAGARFRRVADAVRKHVLEEQ